MRLSYTFFVILGLFYTGSQAQTINFTKTVLKDYMVNVGCVDNDGDGWYLDKVDLNNDGEIQVSEAEQVLDFAFHNIDQLSDTLLNLIDLNYLTNLERLQISQTNKFKPAVIEGLVFENLRYLGIGEHDFLKRIDLSNISSLDSLDIVSNSVLEHLNIKNGNAPTMWFSLFYTASLLSACVDSIAFEYNMVANHMVSGAVPSLDCDVSIDKVQSNNFSLEIYPNPATNQIMIDSQEQGTIKVYNILGERVLEQEKESVKLILDIEHLPIGLYNIQLHNTFAKFVK
jgi:hypothetical protein